MFKKPEHTNHLLNESSPYLLQHLHNPVDWYPWGDEALAKAKSEEKLILISIGYSACHWCHVMESESFENIEIAKIMNDNFICIKVDREERPDVDQIYMKAVQLMTGSGGWPLNCFALSDGSPFYGGTYYKPEDYKQLLLTISESYKHDPQKFVEYSADLRLGINKSGKLFSKQRLSEFDDELLKRGFNSWRMHFDTKWGGTARAPKFPVPAGLKYLMKHAKHFKDMDAQNHLDLTLEKMALGGLYDHIGHGFARYATDIYWKVPHFEKMLYDNSQLLQLYSLAYRHKKCDLYKEIICGIVSFLKEELISPENGFYSSLDADSEGKEGWYYTFTYSELEIALGSDFPLFFEYYNISREGNWEDGRNILWVRYKLNEFAASKNIEVDTLYKQLKEAANLIKKFRTKREKPSLDDKILLSWNALTISGLIEAYRSLDIKEYLDLAKSNAQFIEKELIADDFSLKRNFKNSKASINGFLDDYAFTINAFIKLFQVSFDTRWLELAKKITEYAITNFHDAMSGMFFYTGANDQQLITRTMEIDDNVIPSSNSVMAKNLYILGTIFRMQEYIEISKQMISNISGELNKNLSFHGHWAEVYLWFCHPPKELVIIGDNAVKMAKNIDHLVPHNFILAGSIGDSDIPLLKHRYQKGKTLIYLCENGVCQQAVEDIDEVIKQLTP